MNAVLKDMAVALCAMAYSAAILGLAAVMVVGTPAAPLPPPKPATAVQPASAPLRPVVSHPAAVPRPVQPVQMRDL